MRCQLRWGWLGLVSVLGMLTASAGLGQPPADKGAKGQPATVIVRLLEADTLLTVDDEETTKKGKVRKFVTPPLVPGKRYRYTLVAVWAFNEYTMNVRTHVVSFKAGETVTADMRTPQDGRTDQLVATYGETPRKIIDAMCKLAKVGKDDVVYDLGCGDGRIVIRAVKKFGAKQGVAIDISPEWVKEARKKVKAAGLADKIEVRQGDVLKLTELPKATVVMLFIGEELNKRISPMLKKLPPGTRIVSHNFRMGDWEPTTSQTFRGEKEEDEHAIHLWRIEKKK